MVDPAYRLEKAKEADRAFEALEKVNYEVSEEYERQHGYDKTNISRKDYENLVEAEVVMRDFERLSKKTLRYNLRQFLDPANHVRREKRMMERANERIENKHTIYINQGTEGELQFNDYYETEQELED